MLGWLCAAALAGTLRLRVEVTDDDPRITGIERIDARDLRIPPAPGPLAILGPGDWFGEMSILDVLPRSATMRVVAPSQLLRFSAQDLDTLYRRDLRAYSLLVLNIARELSRRLRVADGLLADLVGNMMDQFTRRP